MGSATYVYVISGDHGRQKIGSSDDPARRIKELQTGSPYQLRFEFIGETEGYGGGAVEVQAHFMLHEHKAPGGDEWFTVPPDVAITAVMAAAHRLGYQCRPVDPDKVAPKAYRIGRPAWHYAMRLIAGIPIMIVLFWLVRAFDSGQIHAITFIICALILLGLAKLLWMALIQIGNAAIAFDRMMHPEGR